MAEGRTAPPRLTKRREFLAAARARKWSTPNFVLQARRRRPEESDAERPPRDALDAPRIGFTASKKVGNAVARNRAKRRLRALADEMLPELGRPGWDYVLIARAETTASAPFARLKQDLRTAIERIHADRQRGDKRSNKGGAPRKEAAPAK